MNCFDQTGIAEILVKKLLDTSSVEEDEQIQRWIDFSDENRRVYEDFMSGRSFAERKKNFNHLRQEETIAMIHKKIERKVRRKIYLSVFSVASVLLVAVLCTIALPELREQEVMPEAKGKYYAILSVGEGLKVELKENRLGTEWQEQVKEMFKKDTVGSGKSRMIRVEVPRGSEYWLRLNDSTEVWLNSETVLTYPERFAKDRREVSLEGEAFFEVNSDPVRPFEVRTDEDLLIRVTGTRLNVRNYKDEPFLKVTLLRGVVYVEKDSFGEVLSPKEQAVFDRETRDIQVVALEDVSSCIAWKEGMFAFESESIRVIFAAMAQWYDVEFIIENELSVPDGKVSFHAMRDDKVEELLGVLQKLIDFRYRIEERKIYIRF